jgi:branched-chain amino acid transport system substrate-binding protein
MTITVRHCEARFDREHDRLGLRGVFMRRFSIRRRFAAVGLGVVFLTACLSTAPSVVAAATKAPIDVGGVALISTATGIEPFAGFEDGINAYFAQINKAGGIQGRKLKLVQMINDGGAPTATTSALQQLVLQDHVYAVIANSPGFDSDAFLAQHGVLAFGWGYSPGFCDSKWAFSFSGCSNSTTQLSTFTPGAPNKLLPKSTPRTVAIVIDQNAAGATAVAEQGNTFEKAGWKVCYNKDSIPATAVDFAPFAETVDTSCNGSPPSVVALETQAGAIGMSAALKAINYKGLILNTTTYNPALLQSPQTASTLAGTYALTNAYGCAECSPTDFKPFYADLKAIGVKYQGAGDIEGFESAVLLVQTLKNAGSNLSGTHVVNALNNSKKPTTLPGLAGIVPPSIWPSYHSAPSPCGAVAKVDGTKFVNALPLTCFKDIPA